MSAAETDRSAAEERSTAAKLDARGLLCPLPVLLTAREIAKLPPGARLLVEGDDRGILEDLPAWCAASGHRLVEIGEVDAKPGSRALIRAVVERAAG
jgi:tRNA 2-thiouridine synthesizing protein A